MTTPPRHGPTAVERFTLPEAEPLPPTERFLAAAADFGLAFEAGELEQLGRYLALLLASTRLINLTAIHDPEEAWLRHIFDALTLLPLLADMPEGAMLADVGSGGGIPGIPLAITQPHLRCFLVESTGKKCEFLRQVAVRLGLKNLTVLETRAEALARRRPTAAGEPGREAFDVVCARAVGRLAVLAPLTVPLAKVGVRVLLVKGQKAEEELADASLVLHQVKCVHEGTVETPTGRIVVLGKTSATPRTIP